MIDLVPVASALSGLGGSPSKGMQFARQLCVLDTSFLGFDDGEHRRVRRLLTEAGVIDETGAVVAVRAAELVIVSSIYARMWEEPAPPARQPRLVFTDPQGQPDAAMRLDIHIADVIRSARKDLWIGSAFWNEDGVERLLSVIEPAVFNRGVNLRIYAQRHGQHQPHAERLLNSLGRLIGDERVWLYWFQGASHALMHAKFVVADGTCGYLGTANLTSQGFDVHVEVGTELFEETAEQLVSFLDRLTTDGIFIADDPNAPGGARGHSGKV